MRILTPLLLVALLTAPREGWCSHIMGAELTYTWMGGQDYVFRLALYRDCQGIAAPSGAVVEATSTGCGQQFSMTLPAVDTVDIATGCSGMLTTCDGGPWPGARLYLYRDTVTLPMACSDWLFTWTECCRNMAISNLVNAGGNVMYVGASLDNLNALGNSSPVFQEFTGPLVCGGVPLCVANTAYDADGDSLVFTMAPAMGAGGSPLAYVPGMSPQQPFPSSTGHFFDAVTGNHCSAPSGLGAYVVSYRVDEFRNGILIGSCTREMQLWVVNCQPGTLTVSGTVLDTLGMPVTAGGVELYAYGLNSAGSIRLDSISVGGNGDYTFSGWPLGQYLVRAIPDTTLYPNTATSYHRETHYWTYADILYAVCDSAIEADMTLVRTWDLNGTGYLEGFLGDLGIIRAQGPGDAWPAQGIVLETWPGRELVAYTWTDDDGIFRFQQVPDGTYRIMVDHPGLPMLAYHVVTLGSGTSSITGLYYTALPEGIDILLATGPGAVRDREAHVRLYPNPATQGWVALVGLEEGAQEWTFMDAAGRVVDKRRIVAADGQARIPLAQVPAGSYLLVPATGVSPLRLVVH